MRFIITPYITELMQKHRPFIFYYDTNEIILGVDGIALNDRMIMGLPEKEYLRYGLYIPNVITIHIPYNVINNGYSAIRQYIKSIGVELAA